MTMTLYCCRNYAVWIYFHNGTNCNHSQCI